MTKEKITIRELLRHYLKKRSPRAAAVEICEVKGSECTVSKTTAIE